MEGEDDQRLSGRWESVKDGVNFLKEKTSQGWKMHPPKFLDRVKTSAFKMQPGLEKVKTTASSGIGKMQPGLERMKTTASSGIGKMQPGLEKMKTTASSKINIGRAWNKLQPGMSKIMTSLHGLISHEVPKIEFPIYDSKITGLSFLDNYKVNTLTPGLSPGHVCFQSPYLILKILTFAGGISDLTCFSGVNLACRAIVHGERRIWRFCVRFGGVEADKRAAFWSHISGADFLQQQADEMKEPFDYYVSIGEKSDWKEAISIDINRTYGANAPHKRISSCCRLKAVSDASELETLQQQLETILYGLVGRFPEIGYCQGMDYVVANILSVIKEGNSISNVKDVDLIHLESTRVFWMAVALFEVYDLKNLFSPGMNRLQLCCYQFQRLFESFLPELKKHFEQEKIVPEMFLVGWFQTVFVYLTALPRTTLDRIWDIFIVERDWKIVFRIALALLLLAQPHIAAEPIDTTIKILSTFPEPILSALEPDQLIHDSLNIKVTNVLLYQLRQELERSKNETAQDIQSFCVERAN